MDPRHSCVSAGRRRVAGTITIVWVAAAILCAAAGGPRALAEDEPVAAGTSRTVDIKVSKTLIAGPAWVPRAEAVETLSLGAMFLAEGADKEPAKSLRVRVFPGELLGVVTRGEKGAKGRGFVYVCQGDEKSPLVFSQSGPVGKLGDRAVFVDLVGPEGQAWLAKQPPEALRALRTIRIAGDAEKDPPLLARFANTGVVVVVDGKLEARRDSPLWRALAATAPRGLFVLQLTGDAALLETLPALTHLGLGTGPFASKAVLRRLTFYGNGDPSGTGALSLADLSEAKGLRVLYLGCERVADFLPLVHLTALRRLGLGDTGNFKDLSPLSGLKHLHNLMIVGAGPEMDISAVGKLTTLEELVLLGSATMTPKDLTPLRKLKKLKVLVVDKKGLDARKAEYDELRKALPDTKIVGFCMGSLWIVVPMLAGAAGVALSRRRKAVARA